MYQPAPLKTSGLIARILVPVYFGGVGIFLLGPLLSMVGRSLIVDGSLRFTVFRSLFNPELSTRNIKGLIRSTVPAVIVRSLLLAFFSGTVTFAAAFFSALSLKSKPGKIWRTVLQLPMGISMVGLAIGLRMLFGDVIPAFILVVAGQFFLALPLVFRIIDTVLGDLQNSLVDCAKSLGARPWFLLKTIHMPVLGRGLLNAYAFSLAIVFADFTIVLGVGRGDIVTFPIAIYRLIGFRSFDLALALSVIYILFCLALFVLIDRTSFKGKVSR